MGLCIPVKNELIYRIFRLPIKFDLECPDYIKYALLILFFAEVR